MLWRKEHTGHYARLIGGVVFCVVLLFQQVAWLDEFQILPWFTREVEEVLTPAVAQAVGTYNATGGMLNVGTEEAESVSNISSWRAVLGNDNASNNNGNYWTTARTASGLSKLIYFDGVEQQGANKMIVTIEDSNITTGNAYSHLICDWISSTDVFLAADADCTGGGWRHLHPLRTDYTNTSDTTRTYDIYDGYFWTTSNTPVATPISNFINSSNGRVIIRTYSTVNSAVLHRTDWIQIEMAIDPVYEPSGYATSSAGTVTNGPRNMIGGVFNTLSPSDNARMTIPMPAVSTPVDMYFTFSNIKTYEGMNSILLSSEMCVSNIQLVFIFYLYNFDTSTWDQATAPTVGSTCNTDTDYVFALNESTITGFDIEDYIDGSGEMQVRVLTSQPGTVYNIQFDRLYIMLGSVNADSSLCEISWGTGTDTDCANTRSIGEAATAVPATSTWQVTSEAEFSVADAYSQDNDDDATGGEYAFAANITVPAILPPQTTVTGIHYAAKYRSGTSTMTLDPGIKSHPGVTGIAGNAGGNGWVPTPGADTNASTVYSYVDTWRLAEAQNDAANLVHTGRGEMNMRLRTSASTNTTSSTAIDWAFLMMSMRWLETPKHVSVTAAFMPTGGDLVVGNTIPIDVANMDSWRGAMSHESASNGASNYWTASRTASGLDKRLYFDDVELLGANKMIITIEDTNVTTGNAYEHQICDWVSAEDSYLPADADCPGSWRHLHPQRSPFINTTDTIHTYEIYDGYFWTTGDASVATPISNFVSSTTGRVIIRTYSTVNSAVLHRTDWAQVEMAIDPVYEPADFTTTSTGGRSGGVSDIIGASVSTNVSASDGTKMTSQQPATSTSVDNTYIFKNVKPYSDANTILIVPEICATNAALTFAWYGYNYVTDAWDVFSATTTPTVCATDTTYAFSANSYSVPGFVLDNYIEHGELTLRLLTAAPANRYSISLDRLYIMLGSVNIDPSECEISLGTGTTADCSNTRSIAEALTATPASTTWQITSVVESQAGQHATDNDDDATTGEYGKAANISFPMTIGSSTQVTGIHYALKFRSNITTETWDTQMKKYGSMTGLGGNAVGGGWLPTSGADSNALTTYGYFDSWQIVEHQNDQALFIDKRNNRGNIRLRTSASTNTGGASVGDWAFAMMSMRYVESRAEQQLTFALSDNSVGFGALTPSNARYASDDGAGSLGVTEAHEIAVRTNAEGGYAVSLSGTTLRCCDGVAEIDAIGGIATTSQTGVAQFGLSLELLGGAGTVLSPYNGSTTLFAFDSMNLPDTVATGLGTGLYDTYSLRYLANITTDTAAGDYNSILTYTVTSTY